jgi:hypothetical protein
MLSPSRTRRGPLVATIVAVMASGGGFGSLWMHSMRQAAWMEDVRATGAKVGAERESFAHLDERILRWLRGRKFVVWAENPRQTEAILQIREFAPRQVFFHVAYPSDREHLRRIQARFPHCGVSHVPWMHWSDLRVASWSDVK